MLFTEFDQEQYDNHRRKEGYQDGHKDGEKKGREEGREEGRLYVLYELTASGDLSLEKAAAQAKMPPEQFERMMEEAGFSRR